MYTNYGYWRASNLSDDFIVCPNTEACLGGNVNDTLGKCATGYQGILCGDCQENFSSTAPFKCAGCPDYAVNIVRIMFILILAVGIVMFLVRSTLTSADKVQPVYSVYLKIIANHFQIISTISNIDFSWPSDIEKLQSASSSMSGISDQIFSFDCFLTGASLTSSEGLRPYYVKLIFFALLPILLGIASVLFWFLYSWIRGSMFQMKDSFISTLVVLLFLVHPNIAKFMFSFFNCMQVDGVFRLRQDIQVICYQGQH